MNTIIKKRWVRLIQRAPHTTKALRTHEGFCYLGLLCDLYMQDHDDINWYWWPMDQCFRVGPCGAATSLPRDIQRWAGLDCEDPVVAGHSIVDHNDILLTPPSLMAKLIEEHL